MFHPNAASDEKKLLETIGVPSFDALIQRLPKKYVNPGLGLPNEMAEMDLTRLLTDLSNKNIQPLSFLGAGAYDHFTPSVVGAITSRGEFATAYTPYQPEASQGTLQVIFEFQSMVAEIFGMDVANASLYDGATALAEAALVAFRHTERNVLLIPDALHPHYRRTLETYYGSRHPGTSSGRDPGVPSENLDTTSLLNKSGCSATNYKLITIACPDGVIDTADLDAKLKQNEGHVAGVVVQTPNFYGCLENAAPIADKAHAAGALLIASSNPLALGVVAPPGEFGADIAVGDGQPLGLAVSFGGPYVGLFACKKELTRKMPGRICGKTVDVDGKTGYVLTLQAREQHIRREKANSNICTNQNLCATGMTVHTAMLGPDGLRELAELNLQLAHYAADQLTKLPGFKLKFAAPFFNEFVLEVPFDVDNLQKKSLEVGVLAGLPLKNFFSKLDHHILVNVTEKKSKEDIDRLVSVLRSVK